MDEKNNISRTKYTVVDACEVKGIPTKFIIDKDGNISEKVADLKAFTDNGILNKMKELIETAKGKSLTFSKETKVLKK